MGKKYIIEIGRLERLYKAFVGAHGKPEITWLSPKVDLTPYTEPDLEQIRKEAYEQGYKDGKYFGTDGAYRKGLADAWEAARKIASDDAGQNYVIFGQHFANVIFNTFTASEAIEEIRQYEQAQNTSSELTKAINDFLDNTGYALANVAEVLRKMGENNG